MGWMGSGGDALGDASTKCKHHAASSRRAKTMHRKIEHVFNKNTQAIHFIQYVRVWVQVT
jgi:hypothetical protein